MGGVVDRVGLSVRKGLGYPGSSNLLVRYLSQGRADAGRPHIAPRKATRILLTRPDNATAQHEAAARISSAAPR